MKRDDENPAPGELDDMYIESVSDQGEIVIHWPGGHHFRIMAAPELAHYYRRLVRRPGADGRKGAPESASVRRE